MREPPRLSIECSYNPFFASLHAYAAAALARTDFEVWIRRAYKQVANLSSRAGILSRPIPWRRRHRDGRCAHKVCLLDVPVTQGTAGKSSPQVLVEEIQSALPGKLGR